MKKLEGSGPWLREVEELGPWLREIGDWMLDNPLGVDMLGAREQLMEAAEQIEALTRRDTVGNWLKLDAERDRYRQGLVIIRQMMELKGLSEFAGFVTEILQDRPQNSLTHDLTP